jgi:hypothetical protein
MDPGFFDALFLRTLGEYFKHLSLDSSLGNSRKVLSTYASR